jgi:hypothetical protein
MIIETISGHETFSGGYETRIGLFYRNAATEQSKPLFELAKMHNSGVSPIGSSQYILACEANKNHGAWSIARYAVRENSFINVLISKKLPGDFIRHNKQLMLYNRTGAALRRITLPFSGHAMATMENGHIEGRFDILTLEQIIAFSLVIPDNVLGQFDFSDELDVTDFYRDQVIEAEKDHLMLNKDEAVTTEKGHTVRIAKPRRRVIVPK